ncbi:MAG: hypothetical protein LBM70_05215 [Victivallales bacterium]|jgi:hypothetical protein|nr:hypothetical protein [Victivallales bacterium]
MNLARSGVVLAWLLFTATVVSAGESLLKFVPTESEYVIAVDAQSLQNLTFFKKLTNEASNGRFFLADFERNYNLRFSDCTKLLFVGVNKRLRGLLAETTLSESDLAQRFRRYGDRFSIEGESGRKIYCLDTESSNRDGQVKIGVTYFEPQTVFAAERKHIAAFLTLNAIPAEKGKTILVTPNGEPLAWSFIDFGTFFGSTSKKRKDFGALLFNGVRNLFAELNVYGDGDSWRIDLSAQCDNAQSARQFAFGIPSYLQLAGSLLFSDDPALGQELLKQIKFIPDGERVIGELTLSRQLAERLANYLKAQAKSRIVPPDPIPADIKAQSTKEQRD